MFHRVDLRSVHNLRSRLHENLDDANVLRRMKVSRQHAVAEELVQQLAALPARWVWVRKGECQEHVVRGPQQRHRLWLGGECREEEQRREHGFLEDGADAGNAEDLCRALGEEYVEDFDAALADGDVVVFGERDEDRDI